MLVDDDVLPAAAHLTGPRATHVLDAAVAAFGGRLEGGARPCHLQYRPGHDVVVRFDGRVRWGDRDPVNETLVVATTKAGPPPGTLPVEAVDDAGTPLRVGVWRWPFDPSVTGLADAVTPSAVATFLDGRAVGPLDLEVLAYRPTLRAVVRVTDVEGTVHYVKAVRPRDVARLVARHEALAAAGVPVPPILDHDAERGLVAMAALAGPTIRDRLKARLGPLPGPDAYEAVYASFAGARLPDEHRVDGRAATALRHAAMLATVLPPERPRLEHLVEVLEPAARRAAERPARPVHGDLYEAQLVTGAGRHGASTITGVLDLDDVGVGDPLDDRATVLAHLLDRSLGLRGARRRHVEGYAVALRRSFADAVDPVELDLVTAGAIVGLATGPFRIQQRRWRHSTSRRLALAARLAATPGERFLSTDS